MYGNAHHRVSGRGGESVYVRGRADGGGHRGRVCVRDRVRRARGRERGNVCARARGCRVCVRGRVRENGRGDERGRDRDDAYLLLLRLFYLNL